jgi:hypothetical protein
MTVTFFALLLRTTPQTATIIPMTSIKIPTKNNGKYVYDIETVPLVKSVIPC